MSSRSKALNTVSRQLWTSALTLRKVIHSGYIMRNSRLWTVSRDTRQFAKPRTIQTHFQAFIHPSPKSFAMILPCPFLSPKYRTKEIVSMTINLIKERLLLAAMTQQFSLVDFLTSN